MSQQESRNIDVEDVRQDDDSEQFFGRQKEEEEVSVEKDNMESRAKQPKKTKQVKKRGRQKGSHKGKKKQTGEHKDASKLDARTILQKMDRYYEEDIELINQNKAANKKLIYSNELDKQLKNVSISQYFIEMNGLLKIEKWLKQGPQGTEPSLTLKKKLFNILLGLNIKENHIINLERASELHKIIQKNKRSMTKDLRDLSQAIVLKWERAFYEMK